MPSTPLDFHGKTSYYAKNTFNPGLAFLAIPTALTLDQDLTLETVQFAMGVALGEDPRYFPSQAQNPLRRAGHALGYVLIAAIQGGIASLSLILAARRLPGFWRVRTIPTALTTKFMQDKAPCSPWRFSLLGVH